MSRIRLLAIVALVALAAFLGSVAAMGVRIGEYQRAHGRTLYVFQPLSAREFTYAGRPVTVTADADEHGRVVVVVRSGEAEVRLPAAAEPGSPQLPGLARHEEWLHILRFAERGRLPAREFREAIEAGRIADRLAIVARRSVASDARSGAVSKRDWAFDLYEFLPEGGFREEHLLFPRTRPNREGAPGELAEGTWQLEAALTLVPSTARPSRTFMNTAMRTMGWTLPVAAFSGLVLILAAGAWLAERRAAREGTA